MRLRLCSLFLLASALMAQKPTFPCSNCKVWNTPQAPFRIYGNTWYVGTHGLSAILITSPAGLILIDGALPESSDQIVANIRSLGYRQEDIKLILNSHAHFDHAGSIPELQNITAARVALSPWSAEALRKGIVPPDDPQFGSINAVGKVGKVEVLTDGQTLKLGNASVTAHFTPGHTPGGTSWTWQSCEENRCLNLVYADSLSAISTDGYLYSKRKEYPHAEDFERSFAFLEKTPCDILLTPHPEAADLWGRLAKRDSNPDAMVDSNACRVLAKGFREKLKARLDSEAGK